MRAGLEMARNSQNFYALSRNPKRAKDAPTAIDLFAGAGGITLGLLNAGFNVRLCSDFSAACSATHRTNFPQIPFIHGDIREVKSRQIMKVAGLSV